MDYSRILEIKCENSQYEGLLYITLKKKAMAMTDFEALFFRHLRQGDARAFSDLFNQYHRLIYTLAYRYLKSREEAEDTVQFTFMKLWEQRETLDFSNDVKSLLFTVAKNYLLNELRHKQIISEKQGEIAQEEEIYEESFLSVLEIEDIKYHLRGAIAKLPRQKRQICRLKIEYGLSNQQVAEKLNISIATVKSHYTQAIKMLKYFLGK